MTDTNTAISGKNAANFPRPLTTSRFGHQTIMDAARRRMDQLKAIVSEYERHGILHSEMLAFCTFCELLGIETIIESGRCRGQSTKTLAEFFLHDKNKRIISIELHRDEDAIYAESVLAKYPNTQLIYGDGLSLLPRLLTSNCTRRVAILLDGPKDFIAATLTDEIVANYPNVTLVAIHDMLLSNPARERIAQYSETFFTDDAGYVAEFREMDAVCWTKSKSVNPHWRPASGGSYGPTLACVFPQPQDRMRAMKLHARVRRGIMLRLYRLRSLASRAKHFAKLQFLCNT